MTFDLRRRPALSAAALGALAVDLVARLVVGEPYTCATALLLLACGTAALPFLPRALDALSVRVAALPVLALASYSILLTTVSLAGIPLTELSIRLSVVGLVIVLLLAGAFIPDGGERPPRATSRDALVLAALAGLSVLSFASAWDLVEPFPPPGADWAYYLLYADEVAAQEGLLIDDPYAGEEDQLFSLQPGIGAVYGSVRILDGISSRSLGRGLAVVSALSVLSVFAAIAGLWGAGAGLVAAAAYSVAPIRLEPMYWHGLGTVFALVLIPVVLLALGLMYRGDRGWRTMALLGLALAGLASMHSPSAAVVAVLLVVVVLLDVLLGLRRRAGPASLWADGVTRPVLGGIGLACVLGLGVIVHLRRQAADLGRPVSYRNFDPHWIDLDTIVDYYSWPLLVLVGVSIALVLSKRELRTDRALLAVGALALAAVLVSQLWRLHVPFEYRRVVYYLGIALVAVIGVSWLRLRGNWALVAAYAVLFVYVAHSSIGLRLPQRLLDERASRSGTVDVLARFGADLEREGSGETVAVVTDRCLGVRVPYLVRRRTFVAAEDWQAGFTNLLPAVRQARTILGGGEEGRQVAESLGVRYVVVDPRCTTDPSANLGARPRFRNDELLVLELPGPA